MPWFISTTLTIFVPLILIYVYVGRRLLQSLTAIFQIDHKRARNFLIILSAYVNLLPLAFLVMFLIWGRTGANVFSGENIFVDIILVYPFWIALVIVVQLFFVLLFFDLLQVGGFHFYKRHKEVWKEWKSRLIVVSLILVLVYCGVRIYLDTWTLSIRTERVALSETAAAFRGFRIAHVSDLQGDARTSAERLARYLNRLNALQPDLGIFTGDLVTSGEQYISSSAAAFVHLRPRLGTFAAVGDHDMFSNRTSVATELAKYGVYTIDDTTITIHDDGRGTVILTGVTYTYRQRPGIDSLFAITNGHNGDLKILIAHQPAKLLVPAAAQSGYHLLLAGHTHGGAIAFGIPGLFLRAPSHFETPYVYGLYRVGQMVVNVNTGIGFTLSPIRFQAPAEVCLLIIE